MKIDSTDIHILKILQKNSRTSVKTISEEVKLSQPSVKSRMEKLKDFGYIKSFTVEIDYTKFDLDLCFLIRISELKKNILDFQKILNTLPSITTYYAITGTDNYLIKGYVKDTAQFEALLSTLMVYGKITSSIVLDQFSCDNILDHLME